MVKSFSAHERQLLFHFLSKYPRNHFLWFYIQIFSPQLVLQVERYVTCLIILDILDFPGAAFLLRISSSLLRFSLPLAFWRCFYRKCSLMEIIGFLDRRYENSEKNNKCKKFFQMHKISFLFDFKSLSFHFRVKIVTHLEIRLYYKSMNLS